MLQKKYQHIFFDLDHTLWDFETNSKATLVQLFQHFDLIAKGIDDRKLFIERYQKINAEMWEQFERGQITRTELKVNRFLKLLTIYSIPDFYFAEQLAEHYLHHLPQQTALFDGAKDVLEYLKAKNYELHLITNGFTKTQQHKINHSGIGHYFTHLISSEVADSNKPNKEIFDFALQLSGAELSHSIMIGDNPFADMQGAKNAGMDRILFNTFGYPVEVDVTHEIKSLRELIDLF